MRRNEMVGIFQADIDTVWDMVTDQAETSWRSDLRKTVFCPDGSFIEYTKDGKVHHFEITEICEHSVYSLRAVTPSYALDLERRFYPTMFGGTMLTVCGKKRTTTGFGSCFRACARHLWNNQRCISKIYGIFWGKDSKYPIYRIAISSPMKSCQAKSVRSYDGRYSFTVWKEDCLL